MHILRIQSEINHCDSIENASINLLSKQVVVELVRACQVGVDTIGEYRQSVDVPRQMNVIWRAPKHEQQSTVNKQKQVSLLTANKYDPTRHKKSNIIKRPLTRKERGKLELNKRKQSKQYTAPSGLAFGNQTTNPNFPLSTRDAHTPGKKCAARRNQAIQFFFPPLSPCGGGFAFFVGKALSVSRRVYTVCIDCSNSPTLLAYGARIGKRRDSFALLQFYHVLKFQYHDNNELLCCLPVQLVRKPFGGSFANGADDLAADLLVKRAATPEGSHDIQLH